MPNASRHRKQPSKYDKIPASLLQQKIQLQPFLHIVVKSLVLELTVRHIHRQPAAKLRQNHNFRTKFSQWECCYNPWLQSTNQNMIWNDAEYTGETFRKHHFWINFRKKTHTTKKMELKQKRRLWLLAKEKSRAELHFQNIGAVQIDDASWRRVSLLMYFISIFHHSSTHIHHTIWQPHTSWHRLRPRFY